MFHLLPTVGADIGLIYIIDLKLIVYRKRLDRFSCLVSRSQVLLELDEALVVGLISFYGSLVGGLVVLELVFFLLCKSYCSIEFWRLSLEIMFFGVDGAERRSRRLVGFLEPAAFKAHVVSVLGNGQTL